MRFLIVLIACFLHASPAPTFVKFVTEHYWRDFVGLVPTDAIEAGTTESGEKTYVGQFSIVAEYNTDVANIHVVPATITKGSDKAIAAYNGRAIYNNETSNAKILCGYKSRYRWIAKNDQFSPNCGFITVGLEDNIPMYVGRATQGREKIIGKVFSDATTHPAGLVAPHQGGEFMTDTYEILTVCY